MENQNHIDWKKEHERASSSNRPKDQDTIDLTKIKSINEVEEEFDNDGQIRKVMRFKYLFVDENFILVPRTLHKKISELKVEYGDRLHEVKVKVEGTGIKTKYDAMPIL